MARLTGIISKLNGSAGNLTFRQNGGQTIVSEKITQTTNAKTELQQKQRLKWANIIREYQVLQPYMKLAFGGTRNGRNDYNKFMSTNLSMTPVYLTKAEVGAGMCIVAPYEITHGTVRSIAVSGKGKKAVTDIRLGTLNITEASTVAEFSNAVVQNNKLYNYGDQITYFLVHQVVNEVTTFLWRRLMHVVLYSTRVARRNSYHLLTQEAFRCRRNILQHKQTTTSATMVWCGFTHASRAVRR